MAVTIDVTLVDDGAGGGSGPNPAWPSQPVGHAGWNNPGGDPDWVPDQAYYKRARLEASGDAGEKVNVVNWEIYSNELLFVADASTVTVQAAGGYFSGAFAPSVVNNEVTRTIWARNAKAQDAGAPYYEETGQPWVSTLRVNGNRVIVDLPVYRMKWGAADTEYTEVMVEAFLPGSFGVPVDVIIVDGITNPDEGLLT